MESLGSGCGDGVGTGLTIVSTVSKVMPLWLTSTWLSEALNEISATNTIAEMGTRKCFIMVDFDVADTCNLSKTVPYYDCLEFVGPDL